MADSIFKKGNIVKVIKCGHGITREYIGQLFIIESVSEGNWRPTSIEEYIYRVKYGYKYFPGIDGRSFKLIKSVDSAYTIKECLQTITELKELIKAYVQH